MLAASSALSVLCAEHAQIRELLTQVDEVVHAGGWACGAQAQALAQLVERLHAYDEATHRPKGVLLLSALRGRSPETDDFLQRLEAMRGRCDGLRSQVCSRLRAAVAGNVEATRDVEALLEEHRDLTLAHLEAEDAFLHSQSADLLTSDEWAAIASSISDAMTPTRH